MHQIYNSQHVHTQKLALDVAATPAPALNNLACFNISAGKAVSADDETYLLTVSHTGIAGLMGYYVAQAAFPVAGYPEMVSCCSVAANLVNLPPDAVVMAFHTYNNLGAGPALPITDPSITWFPLGYDSQAFNHVATPPAQSLTLQRAFPVENDRNNALYFGLAIFGTFTAAARLILGSISLRQVTTERQLFNPNK